MSLDVTAVAAAVTTFLAPFTPFLLDTARASSAKFVEVISEQGGEAAWQKAQALWQKIRDRFGDDAKMQGTASTVAADPADEDALKLFAKTLSQHLKDHPEAARELAEVLGGAQSVQEVIAEGGSWVEDILQSGPGQKSVRASDDSVIKGVNQIS